MNKNAMRRVLAPVLLVILTFGLAACDGDSPTNLKTPKSESVEYRGADLPCYKNGAGKTATMTCDFAYFYQKNPDLLEDSTEKAEDDVEWNAVDGLPLACVKKGTGATKRIACDWDRFYANHPQAGDRG